MSRGPVRLFDGRHEIAADHRAADIILTAYRNVANHFACADKYLMRVPKQSAAIKTRIHMMTIGHDVAKSVLQRLTGKRECDRHCIPIENGFNGFRRFFQHEIPHGQSKP